MRKKLGILLISAAISSFGLVGVPATPAHSCAEIDPAIGCIGPCARPLQGSPTCPDVDPGHGHGGKGGKP